MSIWEDDQTMRIVQLIYCILSTIGCCFIIISFIYLRITKPHYQYVFCLAISQLILSLNGVIDFILFELGIIFADGSPLCKLQACLLTIGQKSGWMYISLISINMIVLSRGHTDDYMKSKGVWIHILSWVVINVAFIGGLWTLLGRDPALPTEMCWTKESAVMYSLYIPMAIFGALNAGAIFYIAIRYVIDIRKNKEVRTNLLTARRGSKVYFFILRISFYPCIFLVIAVCRSLGRYLNGMAPTEHKPAWTTYLTQVVFIEGFFCAVIYGFTPSMRLKYAKVYRQISAKPTLEDAWSTVS